MHHLFRPSPAPPTAWDATIDLTAANVGPSGSASAEVADDVRAAVSALPGAQDVSVEIHGSAPASLRWLSVYRPGSAEPPEGPEWDRVRCRVEAAVRGVTGAPA